MSGRVEAIAMSEPAAGSDVANLSCRANPVDGGYVINGQKTWITGAHVADHVLLVCRTSRDPADKHAGLSMISVPAGVDGMEVRGIETMGGREVNDVYFADCYVTADRLVGREGGLPGGTATVALKRLPSGGSGTVTIDNPSRFSRLTAVLINADSKISGASSITGDWIYSRDSQQYFARVTTDFTAPRIVGRSPRAGANRAGS